MRLTTIRLQKELLESGKVRISKEVVVVTREYIASRTKKVLDEAYFILMTDGTIEGYNNLQTLVEELEILL
jgi:uncharacterized Fe-S cluster-containing radical SAM superfamily protein